MDTTDSDQSYQGGNLEFWIDVNVDEICPSGVAAVCKQDEAKQGNGLKVRLPRDNTISSYSRLIGGPDAKCVYVQNKEGQDTKNADRLWRKNDCSAVYSRACVKRNCVVKEN